MSSSDPSCHCVTCSDEGEPMAVVAVDETRGMALCRGEGGARQTVETALVPALRAGDRVLVHAGVALVLLEGAPA